ncbi:MAG TPA: N-acetylmuramoyl-L-alanine amidase [Caldimonas sp.]|nr:N-acetylmuramoyl-L-alanine amidase [Caldimonas sp.]
MPSPVSLVTVHHEGAGVPTDNVGRFAEGGYTYGLGVTSWARFRDVWSSWGTLNFNGDSVDICLSGNRMDAAVTDSDLELLRAICADARAHGYVVAQPTVRAHKNSPGSGTVCPGDRTMQRWGEVVDACLRGTSGSSAPAPPPTTGGEDVPGDKDYVDRLVTAEGAWDLQYDGGVRTVRGPFYGSYFSLPATARNDPGRRFRVLAAPSDGSGRGYDLVSVKGETYAMRSKQ